MRGKNFLAKILFTLGSSFGGALLVIMMNESVVEAQASQLDSMVTVEPVNAVAAAAAALVVGIIVYIKRNRAD